MRLRHGDVKESVATEEDMPEWGDQEARGIDMEVETAAADLASGSNAVILEAPGISLLRSPR
ncbi:MAG: hypothetical protein ACLTSZ_07100 [Lachnospiraceae bacterium]